MTRLVMCVPLSAVLILTGCLVETYEEGSENIDFQMEPIVDGITTSARPEVGQFGGCTATLISERYFLTAAHCIGSTAHETGGTFSIGTRRYTVDRVVSLDAYVDSSGSPLPGHFEVALGRLATSVPESVAIPARLADRQPATGTRVTVMGYGCDDRDPIVGGGTKRYESFNWGDSTTLVCYGDSGGPVFLGNLGDNGAIVGINSGHHGRRGDESGTDIFADPTFFGERIFATMQSWEDGFEPGIDRVGLDYDNFSSPSADACRDECTADDQCRSFSYVESRNWCWLKYGVPVASPNANVISGLPEAIAGNMDRMGRDYTHYISPSAEECAADCAGSGGRCVAFTYVDSRDTCWLKDEIPESSDDRSCQSGSLRGLEYDVDRPGRDYRTLTTASAAACATSCSREARCVAFSWVESTRVCWLKDTVPPARSGSGITSGVRRGIEVNVDRPGRDISNFTISAPNPAECQAACARNSSCRSWTLTTNPSDSGENRCWLKDAIPGAISSWGMISGLRGYDFF